MKKSLSLLLALAMVFSLFAGVVSAADDTLTTQQKFEALKAKGIFAGKGANQDPALNDDMTRAEGARIIALLAGLDPDSQVVTEQPFPDVAIDAWYAEEVQAVAGEDYFVGDDNGNFNPNDKFTVQQLAIVIAKVLGLEPVEDAEVDGAASWAAGYIQALLDNGINFPTNYTANATRGQLVEAAYVADQILDPVEPAKVSVVSAEATGVSKVTVKLDKAVDTEKATLTLKRASSTVDTKTVWADDNKSATLELESSKIMDAEYSVTLAGLEDDEIANATASFKGEKERVTKLDFVAPSDTVAQSDKVRIEFQALNQYGEAVSLPAGDFNVYASTPGNAGVTKNANGKLFVTLDTDDPSLPVGAQISVNIVNNDSQISVNKIFKLGTKPYVAKVELGEVTYSNGEDYLSKNGDKAVIELIQLDQYGHQITEDTGTLFNASVNVTPYLDVLNTPQVIDDNNDGVRDVVVSLKGDAKASGEYTVNVFGGSSATATINVKSTNYAATVELDTSVTLAEGDADKYIGITAYDKEGNKLSAQDIVDNYASGHLQLSASSNLQFGATTDVPAAMLVSPGLAVVKTGEHKGKIHIASVTLKGYANIFVNINPTTANGIMFNKNFTFNVQEKRYPVALKVETENATKAVSGATSKLKVVAVDQYGDKIKGVIGAVNEGNRTVTYDVYVHELGSSGAVTFPTGAPTTNLSSKLDTDLVFDATAAGIGDYIDIKISLRKIDNADHSKVYDESVSSVSRRMEVINPHITKLTYSIKSIDTLFDAIDDETLTNTDVAGVDDPATSIHGRKVEIEAKTASGEAVAIPDYVETVTSSNTSIVTTDYINRIIGNKAGTATISVFHKTATGESGSLDTEVTVKSDPISVVSLKADNKSATFDRSLAVSSQKAYDLMKLIAKDNYNTEYKAADGNILPYDKHLGIRYTVSEVQGGTVTVDNRITVGGSENTNFGELTISPGVTGFTLTATAPGGQSAVTAITVIN